MPRPAQHLQSRNAVRFDIWLEFVSLLVLVTIAVPLNLRLARKYQRRLDALDAFIKSTE